LATKVAAKMGKKMDATMVSTPGETTVVVMVVWLAALRVDARGGIPAATTVDWSDVKTVGSLAAMMAVPMADAMVGCSVVS
jgi:hypothetical protein